MALLTSPSPPSTVFHPGNPPTRTASLSEVQLSLSAARPLRGTTNGQSNGRPLLNLENAHPSLQGNNGLENGLVNGRAAGNAASSEPENGSMDPQRFSRAWTESQRTLAHRPKPSMIRSKTNYEPENTASTTRHSVEEHGELRHGWEDEYNSSEFLGQLNQVSCHHPLPSL